MPSVRRDRQLALLAVAGVFAAGSLGGCSTTQEKAAAHRAESERILEAREKRQARKNGEHHTDGTKTVPSGSKSARRHEEGEK